MTPRLLFNELGRRVYVVTRFTAKPHPTRKGLSIITAHTKYDVTDDFKRAMRRWKQSAR